MTKDYGVSLSRNALLFERELSYEEWESVGAELFKVDQAWQWWVGDWINYGEKKYGETYQQACYITDKSWESIRKAADVCSRFESGRRRPLSFSHHQEVAWLEPDQQDAILDEAEQKGLPRSWVRERVREIKGEPEKDGTDDQCDETDTEEVLQAFARCQNRVTAILALVAQLELHEREIVVASIQNITSK